jgi:hypothetical protein
MKVRDAWERVVRISTFELLKFKGEWYAKDDLY